MICKKKINKRNQAMAAAAALRFSVLTIITETLGQNQIVSLVKKKSFKVHFAELHTFC